MSVATSPYTEGISRTDPESLAAAYTADQTDRLCEQQMGPRQDYIVAREDAETGEPVVEIFRGFTSYGIKDLVGYYDEGAAPYAFIGINPELDELKSAASSGELSRQAHAFLEKLRAERTAEVEKLRQERATRAR